MTVGCALSIQNFYLKNSMTELDQVISEAYQSQGKQEDVNKVYLTFLRSSLFIPVKKEYEATHDEPFSPLFSKMNEHFFLMAFDTLDRLTRWAGDKFSDMNYVELSGIDFILGIGEQVFLGLNFGTEFYKEFSPDEVKHLKKVAMKIKQFK